MRRIAIWLLHYYSDNRQPLPSWLRRWIDRDPVLSDYSKLLYRVERTLSVQALGASMHRKFHRGVPSRAQGRSAMPGTLMPWLGWGAALAATVLVLLTSVAVWNGATTGETGVTPVPPQIVQTPAPRQELPWQEAPWQEGAKKAKAWALRSLQAKREASRSMASSLDGQLDREIMALRQQMKDATRYVAVKLPVASLKLLGIPR